MAADIVLFSRIILNCGLKHCTFMGKQDIEGEKDNCMTTVSSLPGVSSFPLYKTSSSCDKWRCVWACMKEGKKEFFNSRRHFSSKFGFQSGCLNIGSNPEVRVVFKSSHPLPLPFLMVSFLALSSHIIVIGKHVSE